MAIYGGTRKLFIFLIVKIIGRILFPFFFDIRTTGLGHLPENGPFILLPKHQRWEDIPLLGLVIPRSLFYIAKYELFINPVSSFFISSLGGIPLNRKKPMESRYAIINMFEQLKKGEGIVIFPEGTYYKGEMGPGKTGLLRMIQSRLTLPLIPVGIKYEKKKIRIVVRISLGKPVCGDSTDIIENFNDLIMKEIAKLSGL